MRTVDVSVSEVVPGDVFADLRTTVRSSEQASDYLWYVEAYVEGTNGALTVSMILPSNHTVRVTRL